MCGIVGLFIKSDGLKSELGRLTNLMLLEMRDRGPDSTGFAIYDEPGTQNKLTCLSKSGQTQWNGVLKALSQETGQQYDIKVVDDHAILSTDGDGAATRKWLIENAPDITVLALGRSIEIFKGTGDPESVSLRFGLTDRSGTHAIAHTRMATESAVTTAGSHPFSTGADTCLVHNGSLSNHNRLRDMLRKRGETFQTDNDSEVAAGYFAWRMRGGDSLETAVDHALDDLDGFFTFAIGTKHGFAVVRDPIACKPAVIAETDEWVAMSSEFRAIARLPGVEHAEIWEPEPTRVYSWSHVA
ncbi:MAG: glutamine amidotransferase family protein [Pseudomonadota bacterium]